MPGRRITQKSIAFNEVLRISESKRKATAHIEGRVEGVEIDVAGFVLTIPYPDGTSKTRIQHNGKTLIELSRNTKLFHDGVDLIPDHSSANNPDQRRNALHSEIDVVERMIQGGCLRAAIYVLEP